MATFKVGQRVKVVATPAGMSGGGPVFIGQEGVIIGIDEDLYCPYLVDLPNLPSRWHPKSLGIDLAGIPLAAEHLVPLTDHPADAFIESIKRLQPLNEPVPA